MIFVRFWERFENFKNLKKAKNEINKGAFAETTYQWEDQFSCECNCDGCEIRSVHRTFEYYSMLREITLFFKRIWIVQSRSDEMKVIYFFLEE
jgi:hypothetical protein